MSGQWLISRRPSRDAEIRLFCFPYAGGSAAVYHKWLGLAPDRLHVCGVELPGRGIRIGEEPFLRLPPLIGRLADQIRPLLDSPFAFFGHSMGGLIAYELTRVLRERGAPAPRHLFISATAAPGTPRLRRSLHGASPAEVLEEMRDLGGTPAILLQDPELMAMAVRTLRADYSLLGTYEHRQGPPLDVPITVFGGRSDEITPLAHLRGWQAHAAAGWRMRVFPGDHFFLHSATTDLLTAVTEALLPQPLQESQTVQEPQRVQESQPVQELRPALATPVRLG